MIFKLEFSEKTEFAQAKSQLHLLQEWQKEYDDFDDILEVTEVSDEEAKVIMLKNTDKQEGELDEVSLYDLNSGNDFSLLGSTECD